MRSIFFFGASLLLALASVSAATVDPNFTETIYVSSTDIGFTTGIAWAPDGSGRLFVVRKGGFNGQQNAQVRVVQNGAVLPEVFATESVFTDVESGLLGICFDPDFLNNHYVYILATVSATEQQIIRYTDLPDAGQRAASRTVIVPGLPSRGLQHNGGAVGIGNDGRLYWGVGDLGNTTGVDGDILSLACKIGRVNRFTGAAVNDNPLFGQGNANTDKIWARGYRNPFSFVFQVPTGELWTNMVGSSWEQCFVTQAGSHAGFNMYENNQPPGYLAPIISYRTNGTEIRALGPAGASRVNNVVTFTTTTPHPLRKGATVIIADSHGFDGSYSVASVVDAFQFTVAQTGPDQTGGGGTASTAYIGGALTGSCFYDSTAFPAAYHGNFFFGDYNTARIMRTQLDVLNEPTHIDEFALQHAHHIDMATGPDGALYCAGQDSPGVIRRLAYNGTAQNLIVFPTGVNVVEGGTSVFSVRLNAVPATNVSVTVARVSGDTDLTVSSGASLTFTPANYATPQLVTIAAAVDADKSNDTAVFRVSSSGLASYDVAVNGIDGDEAQLVLSNTGLTVNEGSSNTFTVRLATSPLGDVAVTVARTAGDSDVSVSGGGMLTFTPADFATPQFVTIAAAEDADNTNDSATITVSTAEEPPRPVAITVVDNDPLAPVFTTNPVLTAAVNSPYVYAAHADGNEIPTYALALAPNDMTIGFSTGLVHWTPTATGNYSVIVEASNDVDSVQQSFTIVVNPDMAPTATITRPLPGDVVSGTNAEFFGDGHDDVDTVQAEFFVDGVLRYTDVNTGNHFHFGGTHAQFNTTLFTNGSHVLKMRVTDTAGQTGEQEVHVSFDNGGVASALANISTRLSVQTGDSVLIGGFIVTGTQPKRVIVRAIGPSLSLAGKLANPILELHSATSLLATNDNWGNAPNVQEIIDSTVAPTNALESAILTTLNPGRYTAIVRGVSNGTGIGLVEVYDLDRTTASTLANISSRGFVQTDANTMFGGFILVGTQTRRVIVRAIGPSLNLTGKLADPTLELFNRDGVMIGSNDNWRSTQQSEIIATGVPPTNDLESAIVATLPAAPHTAIVRGKNGTTGLALVEVYTLP